MRLVANIENPKQMLAARELTDIIVAKLGHAETAIAAASRMAGTLILSASGLPLQMFRPGASIQSDSIDRQGRALQGAVSEALAAFPIHLDTSKPDYYIPDANMPRLELRATQELLRAAFQTVLAKYRLSGEEAAYSAALASALLIQQCAGVLDPHIGRAIATIGMMEASKTIPN
jgi:hypothetical protein